MSTNPWYEKGQASVDVGRYGEALEFFQQAIAEEPDHAQAYSEAALQLLYLDRLHEADEYSQKALAMAPQDPVVNVNRAVIAGRLNLRDEAIARFEAAIEMQPTLDLAYFRYGQSLVMMGDLKKAEQVFRQAIDLNPERAHNFYQLSRLVKLKNDDPAFRKLEAMMQLAERYSPGRHANFHYAYANALSAQGKHELAFEHYSKANALWRPFVKYDEVGALQSIRSNFRFVQREGFQACQGLGIDTDAPIFIISMPRTGSTLVEQILSNHPDVTDLAERGLIDKVFAKTGGFALQSQYHDAKEYHQFVSNKLTELGQTYLEVTYEAHPAARARKRFTDKSLNLFQYVGLLHLAMPQAKFIHVRRSILDSCLSMFSLRFAGLPYTYTLEELGRRYRVYHEAMTHWESMMPAGSILNVQYEQLVMDLEGQTRRMLEFVGLPFDSQCLAFHENKRLVNTSSDAQVRKPLYRDSLKRYRPDWETLQPLLLGLGQELTDQVRAEEELKQGW